MNYPWTTNDQIKTIENILIAETQTFVQTHI